ncbi:hypothetical protein LBMAG54_03160 [Nitrosopumilaceae archaeon]|nr:hypothetical protein LBMAG54_03160 [Nitrosopumilaceae archaeon]
MIITSIIPITDGIFFGFIYHLSFCDIQLFVVMYSVFTLIFRPITNGIISLVIKKAKNLQKKEKI